MPPHNVIPLRRRTLAHVLLDIAEARKAEKAAWSSYRRAGDADRYTELHSRALDRLDDLHAEARSMIEAATGVSWDHIAEVGL